MRKNEMQRRLVKHGRSFSNLISEIHRKTPSYRQYMIIDKDKYKEKK